MNEHVFSIDKFNQPEVFTGSKTIYTLIIRLLLMEKGTLKSHPDAGIGLLSRYRYYDADKLDDLRQDIANQVSKYLPELTVVEIGVSYSNNKALLIGITVDNDIYYIFEANFEKNTIELKTLLD